MRYKRQTLNVLVDALNDARDNLRKALQLYWCGLNAEGENDISERNLTYHYAQALEKRGYNIYKEARFRSGGKQYALDLLALNKKNKSSIHFEAKRLYNAEQVRSILADIKKIHQHKVNRAYKNIFPLNKRYGVVMTIVWNNWNGNKSDTNKKDNWRVAFWEKDADQKTPKRSRNDWDKLNRKLDSLSAKRVAIEITTPSMHNDWPKGWMLFAAFKLQNRNQKFGRS